MELLFYCYFNNYVKVNARINELTGMYEMMLLKMCELREAFGANIAFKGSLAGVRPQVYLKIR